MLQENIVKVVSRYAIGMRYCLHNLAPFRFSLCYTCKDPLGKDGTNSLPNTDWSSGVCWRVPVKCLAVMFLFSNL